MQRRGLTLIEVLVCLGLISILTSFVFAGVQAARRNAKSVSCKANLAQIAQAMAIYTSRSGGWPFPRNLGADFPPEVRWPVFVMQPSRWDHPSLVCPADVDPLNKNSYLLNDWIYRRGI